MNVTSYVPDTGDIVASKINAALEQENAVPTLSPLEEERPPLGFLRSRTPASSSLRGQGKSFGV